VSRPRWLEAAAGALAARLGALAGTGEGRTLVSAERRAMEHALRESEQRFRTIAEAHPVPVAIVAFADCRLLYASRSFLEQMRIAPEEVPELTSRDWFIRLEQRERIASALCERRSVQDFEITLRRRDGSVFPAAVTARPITYEGEDAAVFGVLDLTELRAAQAEIARQRDALHQSEKLNALGSLLASVAHELNNPLSVVVGYANMMRDLAADESSRERALKIQGAAERCARIVRTFLSMARRKPEAAAPVRLDGIIADALEVVGYALRTADVEVELDLDPELPAIAGDPDQLTLVLMNLIVNAQHALQRRSGPRRLAIRTRRGDGMVELEVADNGPGVPAELVERIFEPFFTTKPQGVGTGIGLSVCRNVVTGHGGEITVASDRRGGALFRIALPTAPRRVASEPPRPAEAGHHAARILVVDDEPEIAQLFCEVLGRDHHEVLLARSGREALELVEAHEIDLIVSDLRMPDLDGPGLYGELAARRPALAARTIFVTGDVLGPESAAFLERTGLPVLEKPLDPCELRLKVQSHLARLREPAAVPADPLACACSPDPSATLRAASEAGR
jgi:PAS domain S-box-containing protein